MLLGLLKILLAEPNSHADVFLGKLHLRAANAHLADIAPVFKDFAHNGVLFAEIQEGFVVYA